MENTDKKFTISNIVAAISIVAFLIASIAGYQVWSRLQEAQAVIESQVGALSGVKSELQKANQELGLAETNVVSKDKVIREYDEMTKSLKKELKDIKDHRVVKPVSKDKTVVVIEKIVEGGTQTITQPTADGIQAYNWADPTGRFTLSDPNTKLSGDEVFKYSLRIRVTGFVLQDETGNFRARQVIAQEIYSVDGKEVVGEPLPLENNIYEYAPQLQEKSIFDIWHPRMYVGIDTMAMPELGVEFVNLGRYLDFANIGIGTFVAIDPSSLPESLLSTRLGLGLQYTFIPPALSTNIAVGLGISTPAYGFMQNYEITGRVIFFFTN